MDLLDFNKAKNDSYEQILKEIDIKGKILE
jgi:hypothetical protein